MHIFAVCTLACAEGGGGGGGACIKRDEIRSEFVYGHTHLKASVPVPLTEIKQVLVWSVLGRVTTREYQMS